jgi:hypothetical protein
MLSVTVTCSIQCHAHVVYLLSLVTSYNCSPLPPPPLPHPSTPPIRWLSEVLEPQLSHVGYAVPRKCAPVLAGTVPGGSDALPVPLPEPVEIAVPASSLRGASV